MNEFHHDLDFDKDIFSSKDGFLTYKGIEVGRKWGRSIFIEYSSDIAVLDALIIDLIDKLNFYDAVALSDLDRPNRFYFVTRNGFNVYFTMSVYAYNYIEKTYFNKLLKRSVFTCDAPWLSNASRLYLIEQNKLTFEQSDDIDEQVWKEAIK
jgi:hypothetical protein